MLYPLVFDHNASVYTRNDVTFDLLIHLEGIGLIQFNSVAGFNVTSLQKQCAAAYHGQPLTLRMPKDSGNELDIGYVLFTKVGAELAKLCRSHPVDGFMEYVKDKWKAYLPAPGSGEPETPNIPSSAAPAAQAKA